MKNAYGSQIQNYSMIRKLLVKENVPAIEDIIEKESGKLARLQSASHVDLGDIVSDDELKELLPKVFGEVNRFLGVEHGELPEFGYHSIKNLGPVAKGLFLVYGTSGLLMARALVSLLTDQDTSHVGEFAAGALSFAFAGSVHSTIRNAYNPNIGRINVEKKPKTEMIPMAAHEYAHTVQHKNGFLPANRKHVIFLEGHARGVERHIAEYYNEQEDNEAYLIAATDRTLGELKSSYVWMCSETGKRPSRALLRTKSKSDMDERMARLLSGPTPHAIGNALMSIYEAKMGKGIYADMLRGDFQFS
jgi:hypothetical protein